MLTCTVKGPPHWYIWLDFSSFQHKSKSSSTFHCLLLAVSTPVDDFLWSYSQWFQSQMKIEAPPCLPSSPVKHMFQSSENWSLPYSIEKVRAHLWKRQPIPADHRFISCLLFFFTPSENGGCWWSDGQACWALLTGLSKLIPFQLPTFVFDTSHQICWSSQSRVCWHSSNTVVLSDHFKFSASETSNRDNYVSRLTNAQIIMSLLNLIVCPGEDNVHRDSFWCFFWNVWGREIHNPSAVILITFSERRWN